MSLRTRFSFFLSTLGILLWIYVVGTTTVWWIDPNYEFGLFQVLPFWFWVGLLSHLAGTFLTIEQQNDSFFLFQMLILNLMIWGTPIIVEHNVRDVDSWVHIGSTRILMDLSGWKTFGCNWQSRVHQKFQYPGSFVFSAILLTVSRLPQLSYFRFFPLGSSTFFVLGFYYLVRNLTKEKAIQRFSVIEFLFLNFWLLFHVSPQAFGLMLSPIVLSVIVRKEMGKRLEKRWWIIAILLYVSLAFTHSITSLILIAILIGMTAILLLKGEKPRGIGDIAIFCILWVGWFVFNAGLYFDSIVNLAFLNILEASPSELPLQLESKVILPYIIRLLAMIITSAIACVYIVYSRKEKGHFALYAGWIGACYFLLFLNHVVFGGGYSNRSLLFAYFLVPVLVIRFVWGFKTPRNYGKIAIITTFLFSLIPMSTYYYLENNYIISDGCVANAIFLTKYNPPKLVLGSQGYVLYAYNASSSFERIGAVPGIYTRERTMQIGKKIVSNSTIVFDRYTMAPGNLGRDIMLSFYKTYREKLGSNRIYDSGSFEAYQVTLP